MTEAGARFLAGVEPALADIHEAIERLTAERGEVTGLLRINTLRVVLDMALIPILATLAGQHPRLTVEINADQTLDKIVTVPCQFSATTRLPQRSVRMVNPTDQKRVRHVLRDFIADENVFAVFLFILIVVAMLMFVRLFGR